MILCELRDSSHISANDDATNVLMYPHRSTTMQYKKRKSAILLITIILLNKTLVPLNLRARMYVKKSLRTLIDFVNEPHIDKDFGELM